MSKNNPFEGKAIKFDTSEQLDHLAELAKGYGLTVKYTSIDNSSCRAFRVSTSTDEDKYYSNFLEAGYNISINYSDFVASIEAQKFADSITKDAPELTYGEKVVGMYPNSAIVHDIINAINVYKVRFDDKETGYYKTQDEAWAAAYNMIVANTLANKPDMVNHPPHYTVNGIEVIDVIEEYKLNFRLGNSVKYILRADLKGNRLQDLKKALWYLQREIKQSEKTN